MALSAMDIADYIVNKCIDDGKPISNLQLQKILYFCQRAYGQQTHKPLFDDDFEAWKYGPVIPDIYKTFSLYGGRKINHKTPRNPNIPKDVTDIINSIIEEKRDKYPWDLVEITHTKGSPWDVIFRGGDGNGNVIPKNLIFENA